MTEKVSGPEKEPTEASISEQNPNGSRLFYRCVCLGIILVGFLFIMGIETYLGITLYKEQYVGLFLAVCLSMVFLTTRASKQDLSSRVPWYDYILAVAGATPGLYLTIMYPYLANQLAEITAPNLIFGGLMIVLIIEAVRRLEGWPLVILVTVFFLYGHFSDLVPGVFHLRATSFERLINYIYLDPNSMLSLAGIAATIAFAFIFFSDLLLSFRGTAFIRDFSLSVIGGYRGAPAKTAVVASSLFGTITGGAVTNVMAIGSFTIPMMKNAGYPAYKAASIEAISSSGGQIMPPVMSLAAFLVAQFLGIPYAQVALAAVIPAILFYVAVFIQVDLDSAKLGIRGLKREDRPRLLEALKDSWLFMIPMATLVYFLFIQGRDAAASAVLTCIVTIVISAFSRENRKQFWRKIMDAAARTFKTMTTVTVILTAAGIIVAVTNISGLGSVFSMIIVQIAAGNMVALVITTGIACLILGMGMPTVPAYVLVAILAAPALIKMGFAPLAVHLFVLYFAIVSNITPPVAMASIAAAALAKADSMRVSLAAMRLGILAYVVPFLFLFSPELILQGSVQQIISAFLTTVLGVAFLGISLTGFLTRPIKWWKRILALAIAIVFFTPLLLHNGTEWIFYPVGVGLAGLLFLVEWRTGKQQIAAISQLGENG
jgi:TRAP transporter 4TM/12TM fusion protein